ncbi:SGNH/GDSL hydrolase family protein [Pseudoalteromonas luteoviolacea]|uniref:SGNH/GDSL hydrolase family protein n=1 Tax=Pseudoalteromonas luteoviolacea TaxID=43657 RepID=UPI001F41945C|nr:SGNH/GDSL hydrolase family protein [Pseudoalteromonas luteoviolacea]MCF6442019.1 SGNH/GDSL hydrolase family protein [Pseudoalteromonas luteoviolacea]
MSEFFKVVEDLKTSTASLKELLTADENTDVSVGESLAPSIAKRVKTQLDNSVQLVLDSAADVDAVKYADAASGLAATNIGQYFCVVSDNENVYLDLYLHDVNSVATLKKRYPSAEAVKKIDGAISNLTLTTVAGGFAGAIEVNFKERTLDVLRSFTVFTGSGAHRTINPQSLDLSVIPVSEEGYAHYIYIDSESAKIKVGTPNTNAPQLSDLVLGVLFLDHVYGNNRSLFNLIDSAGNNHGVAGLNGNPAPSYGYYGHRLECNWINKAVTISDTTGMMSNGQNIGIPSQTLHFSDFPTTVNPNHSYLVLTYARIASGVNYVTQSKLKLYSYDSHAVTSQKIPASESLVAVFSRHGQCWSALNMPPVNISDNLNNKRGITTSGSSFGTTQSILINPEKLTINLKDKEISVEDGCYVGINPNDLNNNRGYKTLKPQTTSFADGNLAYLQVIWYDWLNERLHMTDATIFVAASYAVIIGFLQGTRLSWMGQSGPTPNLIDGSGGLVDLKSPNDFDEYENRLLVPARLFFVEDVELPIFTRSLFAQYKQSSLDEMNVFLTPSDEAKLTRGAKHYLNLRSDRYLLSQEVGKNGEIASVRMTHTSNPNARYHCDFIVSSAPRDKLRGQAKRALLIGDSLTEVGMSKALKDKMQREYDCSIDVVGTYSSTHTEGVRSEGRGYWSYRSFIGKCNFTGARHSIPQSGVSITGKWQNPFLRIATSEDLMQKPDFCFAFTGSVKEKSYADDPNLGAYYIFDFAHYLQSHSVDIPDFLTIALSTNDINLHRDEYTQDERMFFMEQGLHHMLSSIKKVVPNCKIGVVPAPMSAASQAGFERWKTETAIWIEKCHEICMNHGVDFLPVYLHMPRDYSNPWGSTVRIGDSMMSKSSLSDWVHFDENGRDLYCNVTSAWIMNRA